MQNYCYINMKLYCTTLKYCYVNNIYRLKACFVYTSFNNKISFTQTLLLEVMLALEFHLNCMFVVPSISLFTVTLSYMGASYIALCEYIDSCLYFFSSSTSI